MGQGFGLSRQEMLALADGNQPVLRDVQSLTDWLWHINTKGTLAEAVAATSFAVEGITGDMCRKAADGFESYRGRAGVDMTPKTYKWMRGHARYDDDHPKIALEVIKRYATSERLQTKAMLAAKRSLQLLNLAFNTSYRAYSQVEPVAVEHDLRVGERRRLAAAIAFPERRFADRRGRAQAPIA
jgi:pyrroloquinoline quinone (PQQ) biosynthesis protein C